jgi:DNA (cytosine-5)-methyltransferase 1
MRKPKLLDLFCGAGGCSVGYSRAGFDVVGVDVKPQPNYPFEFHQADALQFPLTGFDAIHASPPCQAFTRLLALHPGVQHPNLVAATRARLIASGKPYAIENVPGAPLLASVLLCGTMFGLRVIRHRLFECHPSVILPPCACNHPYRSTGPSKGSYGGFDKSPFITCAGHNFRRKDGTVAMGIDWHMSRHELAQSIPPAYTEWIGKHLIAQVKEAATTDSQQAKVASLRG